MNYKELFEHISKCDDLKIEKMHIPEWKCDVWVRQLSALEQDDIESKRHNKDGTPVILNLRARYVTMCLVDEDGNKIFTEKDIHILSKKAGSVINRLIDKCSELNRLTEEDLENSAKN